MNEVLLVFFDSAKREINMDVSKEVEKYGLSLKVAFVESFFDMQLLELLEAAKETNSYVVGIKYPNDDEEDLFVVREFLDVFLQRRKNLWYFPKLALNASVRDFSLFGICDNWNLDHFKIEISYRKGIIDRILRNRLHDFLRKDKGVSFNLQDSSLLSNLAYGWEYYNIQKNKARDLVDRAVYFYPYPRAIAMQITNKCNLSCIMCPFHAGTIKKTHSLDTLRRGREMEFSVVKNTVDYIVDAQKKDYIIALNVDAVGEPLTHKNAVEFVYYAKKAGVKYCTLITNGMLLGGGESTKLLDARLDVLYVSIDGARESTYENIRKGGKLFVVENNLKTFIELARKRCHDVEVYLNCVLIGDCKKEVEEYREKWRPYRDYIKEITFSYLREFNENGEEILHKNSDYADSVGDPDKNGVCSSPWDEQLIVNPDGNVLSVCCPMNERIGWDYFSFGKIENFNSFGDIWNSDNMRVLRYENFTRNFEVFSRFCENCERRIFNAPLLK